MVSWSVESIINIREVGWFTDLEEKERFGE